MPPGTGWEKPVFTLSLPLHLLLLLSPGARTGLGISFSFRPRAAPELYGSPELGVRGYSCIGGLAGAPQKKVPKDEFRQWAKLGNNLSI